MVTVPGFLLRRLYVKGSLRNTGSGFGFTLMNKLGAGYARKLLPLTLDNQEVPLERCFFSLDGGQFSFDTVSNETPFMLDFNKATVITIEGAPLNSGPHRIGMGFEVAGLGTLRFDFTDVPSDG